MWGYPPPPYGSHHNYRQRYPGGQDSDNAPGKMEWLDPLTEYLPWEAQAGSFRGSRLPQKEAPDVFLPSLVRACCADRGNESRRCVRPIFSSSPRRQWLGAPATRRAPLRHGAPRRGVGPREDHRVAGQARRGLRIGVRGENWARAACGALLCMRRHGPAGRRMARLAAVRVESCSSWAARRDAASEHSGRPPCSKFLDRRAPELARGLVLQASGGASSGEVISCRLVGETRTQPEITSDVMIC